MKKREEKGEGLPEGKGQLKEASHGIFRHISAGLIQDDTSSARWRG